MAHGEQEKRVGNGEEKEMIRFSQLGFGSNQVGLGFERGNGS